MALLLLFLIIPRTASTSAASAGLLKFFPAKGPSSRSIAVLGPSPKFALPHARNPALSVGITLRFLNDSAMAAFSARFCLLVCLTGAPSMVNKLCWLFPYLPTRLSATSPKRICSSSDNSFGALLASNSTPRR